MSIDGFLFLCAICNEQLELTGTLLRGCGACPQKDFTDVLLQRFKALFQVPSSVSLLFICYVLIYFYY